MADRNSIIEKIKALLSKTTENGATEAEMMSALDKASAMMDAYDISDEEVKVTKEEAAILHADPPSTGARPRSPSPTGPTTYRHWFQDAGETASSRLRRLSGGDGAS